MLEEFGKNTKECSEAERATVIAWSVALQDELEALLEKDPKLVLKN